MPRSCHLELAYALAGAIPDIDAAAPLISSNPAFNTLCVKVPLLGQ
jgi:hypothetical protein